MTPELKMLLITLFARTLHNQQVLEKIVSSGNMQKDPSLTVRFARLPEEQRQKLMKYAEQMVELWLPPEEKLDDLLKEPISFFGEETGNFEQKSEKSTENLAKIEVFS